MNSSQKISSGQVDLTGSGNLVYKDTAKKTHTGVTAYTRLVDIEIPANTIVDGDVWLVEIGVYRGATNAAGNAFLYASLTGDGAVNESNDFIRDSDTSGALAISHYSRRIKFDGGLRRNFNNSGGFYNDLNSLQNMREPAFDLAIGQHLYAGLSLSSSSDVAYLDYVIFRKIS